VVHHLIDAGFNVTVLSRDPSKASGKVPSEVNTVKADYTSVETLVPVLKDKDFVSLVILINRNQATPQIVAIDAAIAAGIPHIVPSSFGVGTSTPEVRAIPSLAGKIAMEDHLLAAVAAGRVAYTSINTGVFLEWCLDRNILFDLAGAGPTRVYDGGDVPVSTTRMGDIGTAVAAAVARRGDEGVRNRVLSIHSAVMTHNQMLGFARQAAPEREFPAVNIDTAELKREAWAEYNAGSRSVETMRKFIVVASMADGVALLDGKANELLGVKMMSEEELRQEVVKRVIR
jgi:nucleoside-diphosphate-sugar epimerase